MDCFVYVLGTLAKNRHQTYVGWTNDVTRRLAQHNAGKGARTTRGRPRVPPRRRSPKKLAMGFASARRVASWPG